MRPESATDQTVEFVTLAYGDVHCLHFTVGMRDLDQLTDCLQAVGSYNGFDAESVGAVLEEFWPQLGSIEFGRANSPVLYVTIPHWTHQANGCAENWGEPIPEEQRLELAQHFLRAMKADGRADELSYEPSGGDDRTWFEFPTSAPEGTVYRLRCWWD